MKIWSILKYRRISNCFNGVSMVLLVVSIMLPVFGLQAQDKLNQYLIQAAQNNPGLKARFNEYQAALEKVHQVGTTRLRPGHRSIHKETPASHSHNAPAVVFRSKRNRRDSNVRYRQAAPRALFAELGDWHQTRSRPLGNGMSC